MSLEMPADCPNCHTDDNSETDCPHLLAGDACPNCGSTLSKPPAGKVECERCFYVVNGRNVGLEGRDHPLTARQMRRLLVAFGYEPGRSAGNIGTTFRRLCYDLDVGRDHLRDVLADIRGVGDYNRGDSE